MRKKGGVEVQFNWILILVAGALIFLFFFGVIRWAKKGTDESTATTLSNYLDSIFTGAAVTKETVNTLNIPFNQIEFNCQGYRVDKSTNIRTIRNKIIFSPSIIEGDEFVTWSIDWSVPFRVTNFLYLSSPKIRYVFYGDENNDLFRLLQNTFPEALTPEFNPTSLEDENNYKVRIIYINQNIENTDISNLKKMEQEDVTALHISGNSFDSVLNIRFHNKNPIGVSSLPYWEAAQTTYAFGKASLFAAIFSEKKEDYECNMAKAFKRLNNVAEIYKRRAGDLYDYYHSLDSCSIVYIDVASELDNFRTSMTYNELENSYQNLKSMNSQAQRSSCSLIY